MDNRSAFHKKRWEKALPYFARSGDKEIAKLSQQDIESPRDFADQLALGEKFAQVITDPALDDLPETLVIFFDLQDHGNLC